MLQKKLLTGRKVEVTFRMPPLDDVVELYLCGDFNAWQASGVPLMQESDGTWVAKLVLDSGKIYRFRYSDNQGRWHNDWEADAYVPNDFGSEDCVLDLRGMPAEKKSTTKQPAARKPAAKKSSAGVSKKAGRSPRAKAKD